MTETDVSQAGRERATRLLLEAQHARRRYDLYKAKTYGPRQTSAGRLRDLKQAAEFADARARRAWASR
jgi:hypothetical protein